MILSEKLLSLIKLISSLEKKDEDKLKWQSAYLEVFEKGYFSISRDNLEKILNPHPIDSPFTTYGEIILIKHIKRINLDLRQLKKTVEVAIRFLDGSLSVSNFSEDAKAIVENYRKIGLGVADFDSYCVQTNQDQYKAIKVVGELISDCAYRTSEELAIEKGAIPELDIAKVYNRGKLFARYINNNTGVVIDGFVLKQMLADNKISADEYSLVPRRNSHLLLLPNQEIWFPYTDRVEGDSNPNTQEEDESNSKFSKGELVKITNNQNENYQRSFQIVDFRKKQNKNIYILKSENNDKKLEVGENDIESVDLNTVLSKLNTFDSQKTPTSANNLNIKLIGLILNNNDTKVLATKSEHKIPEYSTLENLSTEISLIESIRINEGVVCEILDEIGTVLTDNTLYIAYWLNSIEGSAESLEWVSVEEYLNNDVYSRIFMKLNRKKKIYSQYEAIIKSLEDDKDRILNEQSHAKSILIVHERPKQQLSLGERVNSLFGLKARPKEYLRLQGGNNVEDFEYDDSRYLLSLQQNIVTDEFGTVKIIMEYSKNGIKSIQLYPEFFKSEERFLLDLYIELVNLCLQNNVSKIELIKLLYKYERELGDFSLIEVVKLIRQSLNSSPDNFNDLSNKVY
jgi:Ribonucleotide reductase, barrel domain